MSEHALNPRTKGFCLSLAIASVLSGLLVFLKEMNEGVMKFMKMVTVHHWVTHAVFDVAVFILLGYVLSRMHDGRGPDISDETTVKAMVGGVLAGLGLILVFYGIID